LPLFLHGHFLNKMLEEKPAHHPSEPLDVTLKHTGLDAAYLLSTIIASLASSARVEKEDVSL